MGRSLQYYGSCRVKVSSFQFSHQLAGAGGKSSDVGTLGKTKYFIFNYLGQSAQVVKLILTYSKFSLKRFPMTVAQVQTYSLYSLHIVSIV